MDPETPAIGGAMAEDGAAAPAGPDAAPPPRPRLVSLDALRGFTILGMLLVNNSALDRATPATLTHAGWNQGVHFADLIYPWFLFMVGVAIPYAVASHRRRGWPMWRYDVRVVGRALTLVLLGCLINSSLARRPLFDLGVLQLIGMAYFVGALLYELPVRRRLLIAGGLLLIHWAAIRFVAIPGVGAGVFTQTTNLINHLNQVYLDRFGLRGVISVVPTSALVLIGSTVGDLLRHEASPPSRKVAVLLLGGVAFALAGWWWSLDLPFNKPVWTSSYILFSAGLGGLALGVCYLVLDVWGWRAWAFPLVVLGMNSITAFVLPILVKAHILHEWTWRMPDGSRLPLDQAFMHVCFSHAGRIGGGWLYTVSYIVFWWLVLFYMYRKRVFLRV